MQQLKQKLKAGKRPKNSGWDESPLSGEIEIVIPNKKFKGSNKLQPPSTPTTPQVRKKKISMSSNNNWLPNKPLISEQNLKETSSTNSRNRRVNFVLNKNTAQGKA